MDVKSEINKVVSTYRVTEDHMDSTWSNLQKALDKKSTASTYNSIDPQLAMLRVLEYLMGDGNICHPYEMYYNVDAQEHRYQKQVGTTAGGQKIYEDSDETVPTGQMGTLDFMKPMLESFFKKNKNGEDGDAIARTLRIAGYQQARAISDATLYEKGTGSKDIECIEHDARRSSINTDTATRLYEIQSVMLAWYKATQGEAFVPWSQKQADSQVESAEKGKAILAQVLANAKTEKVLSNQVTADKQQAQADEADGIDQK
tara:strand:- start:13 stop:789 length:777 start_codon:yes stop_codon:yes gene_type:complete